MTFQTDAEAMGVLERTIKPSFIRTLEDMLNVNLYMDGLTNIFSLPEYNDLVRPRMFGNGKQERGFHKESH